MERRNAFAGHSKFPWADASYWPSSPTPSQDIPNPLNQSGYWDTASAPLPAGSSDSEEFSSTPPLFYGSLDEGPFDAPCDPIADLIDYSQD